MATAVPELVTARASDTKRSTRVTARRHLERLVDTGVAERRTRHGRSGRPGIEHGWR